MTAPKLQDVGDKGGPCADDQCTHNECCSIRKLSAKECTYCGKSIGYNTGFYILGECEVAHSDCHHRNVSIVGIVKND